MTEIHFGGWPHIGTIANVCTVIEYTRNYILYTQQPHDGQEYYALFSYNGNDFIQGDLVNSLNTCITSINSPISLGYEYKGTYFINDIFKCNAIHAVMRSFNYIPTKIGTLLMEAFDIRNIIYTNRRTNPLASFYSWFALSQRWCRMRHGYVFTLMSGYLASAASCICVKESFSQLLTHWGRDEMAAIFQTTISYAFSSMKMFKFQLRFHWSLFQRAR